MHQSHRLESDVTIAPQEPPAPAPEPGELTAAELALVVGGGDGGPGGPTDNTGRYGV
jgi:hypothetical protein